MHSRSDGYVRLPVVGVGILVAAAVIGARLIWLGVVAADAGTTPTTAIPPQRGAIWDRHGRLLAAETYVYDVGVATNEVRNSGALASAVAPLLGLPEADLLAAVSPVDQRWVPLAKDVSAGTAAALDRLALKGLYLQSKPRRLYPLGPDAAHVTGFVNVDGQAYYGVEGYLDELLAGRPGNMAGNYGTDPRDFWPPLNGADVVLTIDADLQVAVADVLAAAVADHSASGGTVVVLDPATGEVLVATSLPSYDPNRLADADATAFIDPAACALYEPGSVVKAFTMAAALDTGLVGVNSSYEDTGVVEMAGLTIANWDRLAHGQTSMTELLQHSLNVGAVHLAQGLGPSTFYSYLSAFGFGQVTGVGLAGEVAGIVHTPSAEPEWYEGNLATNSFGQGMAATPLQVAAAFGAIANDGLLVAPHIVAAQRMPNGQLEPVAPQPVRQVVAPATARAVREMLEDVVLGRVTKAALPGYSVGGKTGTSQIPVAGGYDHDGTIASFAGFLPVGTPRVVILVKIDRPSAPRGSDVAAPVFREVAKAVIATLDMPPDQPVDPAGLAP